ncbi:hypothetical protein [Phenylobacterium sp.]|jgi:hypothetical protein|uniref:hypothetical protein n=1 Tax=Phenylobacterium sp. TaxID=1871053 RepID=UPI002E36547C|nr:hypothetical protein [Phenylobacterium sp.]HEX3366715.1 hypothetical protein [Phenylobacterium sp.]
MAPELGIAEAAGWFLGAGVVFYLEASFWESLFHEFLLDLNPARRRWMFALKRFAPSLYLEHYAHNVLHHFRTYRGAYTRQFESEAERLALDVAMRKHLTPRQFRRVTTHHYGASFEAPALPYLAPALLNLLCLPLLPDVAARAGVLAADLVFATPYWAYSKWMHLYLHRRFDAAVAEAPGWMSVWLRSDYGVAVRISHYLHHRQPTWNYNLQYGADLLRGRWRPPTAADWDDMLTIGLVTPAHRARFEGRRVWLHPF